jgi:hypothetical protein
MKATSPRTVVDVPLRGAAGTERLRAELDGDKVKLSLRGTSIKLREGEVDLADDVNVRIQQKGALRSLEVRTAGAPDPLVFKLGADGFEQVANFGSGMGALLQTLTEGVKAAVTERGTPKAGTVIAEQKTANDRLRQLEGVRIETQPRVSKEEWAVREKAMVQRIVKDPVGSYADMRRRLETDGPMAPFPELEPAVGQLLESLRELGPRCEGNPALLRQRQIAMTRLVHVGMAFRVDAQDYPYAAPFAAPYPYKATLDAIRSAVEFLDVYASTDPKQPRLPLYHTDRYQYYWDALTLDPRTPILPTLQSLGFEDLIRTRSVPIGFVGVATETVFVDRHQNSPLEFFVHDVNHVRRMNGYADRALEARGAKGRDAELAVFKEWNDFIGTLLPALSVKGKTGEDNMKAHMFRLLVFEILHESAVSPTREAMLECLRRPAGAPDPFEHMLLPGAAELSLDAKNIEEWRNRAGNLASGANELGFPSGNITVRYFMDRAVVLLGNVYNKIAFGFYDEYDDPKGYVAKPEDRTPENVAKAAVELYRALGVTDVKVDDLIKQARSQSGSEELFAVYPKTTGVKTPG